MKRSTVFVALMLMVAVLVPATAASAAHVASGGGATAEHELSSAQMWKARVIAGYFPEDVSGDNALALVIKLRTEEPTMGWGVLSKLVTYAAASDMGFEAYLASAQDGGYSMGELRKEYLESYEIGDLPPKNFGQMQKEQKLPKPGKADKKPPPGHTKKSQG